MITTAERIEHHHARISQTLVGQDNAAESLTIHARHLRVDDRHAKGIALLQRPVERLESPRASFDGNRPHPPACRLLR